MSKIDTGGEVYPGIKITYDRHGDRKDYSYAGFTLLDYFAGQAINGMVANKTAMNKASVRFDSDEPFYKFVAEMAYSHAAAMVAEKRRLEAE